MPVVLLCLYVILISMMTGNLSWCSETEREGIQNIDKSRVREPADGVIFGPCWTVIPIFEDSWLIVLRKREALRFRRISIALEK